MRNLSNKLMAISGVFLLMSALLYVMRFIIGIIIPEYLRDHKAMAILMVLVLVLFSKWLNYLINKKDLTNTEYRYFGDWVIYSLLFIAFFTGLAVENKNTWICVMGSFLVVATCLAYGHVRAVDAAVRKKEMKIKKSSPFLSGIKVGSLNKEQLMKIVESMKSDGDNTTVLLASSLGDDEWVVSFPQGVSIDGFMDVLLEICMGIDEANHPEEYSESYDVTGYYQFIDGKLDGKMLMFTCEKEYAFNIVDSQGISYIDGAQRKRFFSILRKINHHFVPTGKTGQDFIPFDLKEAIIRGAVVKQIKIENYL